MFISTVYVSAANDTAPVAPTLATIFGRSDARPVSAPVAPVVSKYPEVDDSPLITSHFTISKQSNGQWLLAGTGGPDGSYDEYYDAYYAAKDYYDDAWYDEVRFPNEM